MGIEVLSGPAHVELPPQSEHASAEPPVSPEVHASPEEADVHIAGDDWRPASTLDRLMNRTGNVKTAPQEKSDTPVVEADDAARPYPGDFNPLMHDPNASMNMAVTQVAMAFLQMSDRTGDMEVQTTGHF